MDVRCERCNTEYEFDDALVSGRGTTVKCTNCGHKFRIRRGGDDISEDFWNVQTNDGRALVFTSLRQLQRAIQSQVVRADDLLSRGGLSAKPISQIPELVPFFTAGTNGRPLAKMREPLETPPLPGFASRPPPLPAARESSPPRAQASTHPDFPPPPLPRFASEPPPPVDTHGGGGRIATLVGPGPSEAEEQRRQYEEAARRELSGRPSRPPPPLPKVTTPSRPAASETAAAPAARAASKPPPLPPPPQTSARPPAPSEKMRTASARPSSVKMPVAPAIRPSSAGMRAAAPATDRPSIPPPLPTRTDELRAASDRRASTVPPQRAAAARTPAPAAVRESVPSHAPEPLRASLSDRPSSFGNGRSVGGFLIAAAIFCGITLVFVVWARDHLGASTAKKPPTAVAPDPKVLGLLSAGEKALAEGNLELAKENADKASVLAEKDPHVLNFVAHLASARADAAWLKARLLPPEAQDELKLTHEREVELAATARTASDEALAVSPDEVAAVRAKVDALRISGERDAARALAGKIASTSGQPETAYVLAALDVAEADPPWSSIIERLRTAVSAEAGPGRARAMLVYALARSGDVVAAKAELERLAQMPRATAQTPLLRAYVERAKPSKAAASALASGVVAAVAPTGPTGAAVAGGGAAVGGGGGGGDARSLVAQAEAARNKGEYEKARGLYQAAVGKNGGDSEALNGLAAIAYAQRDLPGARAAYKRVLAINPSYLPALVGLADVDWESGDRGTAVKSYKEIVDRFPEGTYPPRARARSEGGSGPAPAANGPEAPAEGSGGGG